MSTTDFEDLRDRLQKAFSAGEKILHASGPVDYNQEATHTIAQATALNGLAETANALLKIEEKLEKSNLRRIPKPASNAS